MEFTEEGLQLVKTLKLADLGLLVGPRANLIAAVLPFFHLAVFCSG
jgi:hypothetical protein